MDLITIEEAASILETTKGNTIQILRRKNIEIICNDNRRYSREKRFVHKEDVHNALSDLQNTRDFMIRTRNHILSRHGAFTSNMIANDLKIDKSTARKTLVKMYRAGKLKRKYMVDYGYVYIVRKEVK